MAIREVYWQITDEMARVVTAALANEVDRCKYAASGTFRDESEQVQREQNYRDALYVQEEWRKAIVHNSRRGW